MLDHKGTLSDSKYLSKQIMLNGLDGTVKIRVRVVSITCQGRCFLKSDQSLNVSMGHYWVTLPNNIIK